jgi:hypothetical protein
MLLLEKNRKTEKTGEKRGETEIEPYLYEIHYVSVNSSSAHPPPPGLRSFPNPGGGAIAKIFQPGGWDLDVFRHGD